MLRSNEQSSVCTSYFSILKETDIFIEIMSNTTKHCWILQRRHHAAPGECPILIYHKHSHDDAYYHKHGQAVNVRKAVEKIKKHDAFVTERMQS